MGLSIGHRTLIDLLHTAVPPGGTVIDAGAFPGTLTTAIAQGGWRVTAVDTDPERGITVQDRYAAGDVRAKRTCDRVFRDVMADQGITTVAGDLERDRLPLPDESVDAVVMAEVIEHLVIDPLWALAECNRVLRTGGVLLITTPNLISLRHRVAFALGHMDRVIQPPYLAHLQRRQIGHVGHVRLYAPGELADMVRACGFSPEVQHHAFDYWESQREDAASAKVRRPMPRLLRTPRQYVNVAIASAYVLLERAVPSFRSHLFVIGRKSRRIAVDALSRDVPLDVAV